MFTLLSDPGRTGKRNGNACYSTDKNYLGFAEFRSRAFQGRQGRRDQSARISVNDLTFTLKVA